MIISDLSDKLKALSDAVLLGSEDENGIESFHAQYEVKEELGRGLTSIVCKCIDKFTGEKYAVKIIDLFQTCDLDIVDSIVSEVTVLRSINAHPNITSMYKVYRTQANVYILLELAPNGELFDYVNQCVVLSEKIASLLMGQLLLGLEHLHKEGVVHRDIKMENVLMNDNLGIKLTDFGFAKKLRQEERLHDLCGTLSYIAPEMISAEYGTNPDGYGLEVDMWACGVLLYTLIMGQPPFFHPKQLHLMRQIQECRYDRTSDTWLRLSESARCLITRLLEVNVAKRLTAKQALEHAWIRQGEAAKKKSFRQVGYIVWFIVALRIRVRKSMSDSTSLDLLKNNQSLLPYQIKKVRCAMDDVAFTIYGHWVQREDPTSRGTMFRHRKRMVAGRRTLSMNE